MRSSNFAGLIKRFSILSVFIGFSALLALANTPTVYIPTLNPTEAVVAAANVMNYGAVADGVTDNTGAFEAAINAVYIPGQRSGGVVYVPAGTYAFTGNLTVPLGVTLHGDWKDWTTETTGAVGTIFAIYTTGAATDPAFLTLQGSDAVVGVTFWYPNQNPASIQPYPYTISCAGSGTVQNVVLVNSYQGINANAADHELSTVVGTPLLTGIYAHSTFDVGHMEDIRFSPAVWSSSGLPGAPAANGPHVAWILANGTGIVGGSTEDYITSGTINGYNIGINMALFQNQASGRDNGSPNFDCYNFNATNCVTALQAAATPNQLGSKFTTCSFSGTNPVNDPAGANLQFDNCTFTAPSGGNAFVLGGGGWQSWLMLMDSTVNGSIQMTGNVINAVNCTFNAPTQCTMGSGAVRAAFTGCTFSPAQSIVNNSQYGVGALTVDSRKPSGGRIPTISWSDMVSRYYQCQPATTALYVATTGFGAYGDGVHDDTSYIQSALSTAAANGGGIVYLPAGHYKITGSLDVPSSVELRGVYETRHVSGQWPDGYCKASVLQPYGGQGTTSGPPAVLLEANSGIRGVDFNYETQNSTSSPTPFPPAIQGRGANVYAISVTSPNAFNFIDLTSYSCPNHFLENIDGWAINSVFTVGNRSSGDIICCHFNASFWVFLNDSASTYNPKTATSPTYSFQNLTMATMGFCNEIMLSDFLINAQHLMHTIVDHGGGPVIEGVSVSSDGMINPYLLDAPQIHSHIDIANGDNAVFDPEAPASGTNIPPLYFSTVVVQSTANNQGYFRLFNSCAFGNHHTDFNISGSGDVGAELFYELAYGFEGAQITSGAFHLIDCNGIINYENNLLGNDQSDPLRCYPFYPVAFSGTSATLSDTISIMTYQGCTYANEQASNFVNLWHNFDGKDLNIVHDLMDPWLPQDVGTVGHAGSTTETSATQSFAVTGAGSSTSGTGPDSFQYCNYTLTGDGSITAHITSQQVTGGNPIAGVMMRATLDPQSPFAMAYVMPGQCRFQGRQVQAGGTGISGSVGAYTWVRVVRSGSAFTGYYSTDGITWTQVGSKITFSATDPIYVGLVVCSGNASVTNTAQFTNVQPSP